MAHPYQQTQQRQKAKTPTKPNVVWDDREKHLVAQASFRILLETPSLSQLTAVMRGQLRALPENRHREVSTFGKFSPWIKPLWEALAAAELKAQGGIAPESTPESVVAPEPSTTVVPDVVAEPARKFRGMIPGTTVVRWKTGERDLLGRKVHALRKSFPDMSPIDALRKAMEIELPANRQRELTHYGLVRDWLAPLLKALDEADALAKQQAREAAAAAREARRVAEQATPEVEVVAKPAEALQAYSAPLWSAPTHAEPGLGLEAIMQLLAERLATTFVSAIEVALRRVITGQLANVLPALAAVALRPAVAVPPRTRQPRVTVVGLLNQQEEDVRRAFAGVIDFVFVKSQQTGGNGHGGAGMVTKSATSDLVIAMVGHCGHDVESHSKYLKVPFERVNGSATGLKRWLTNWLAGTQPQSEAA